MKKLAASLIFSSLLFWGCSEADLYSVTAKVNNQPWKSDGYTLAQLVQEGILINAQNSTLPTMSLIIGTYANIGTFSIDSTNNAVGYGNMGSGYSSRPFRPGVLTITEFQPNRKHIKGTFNCVLFSSNNLDSIIITDGTFDVTYQ